MELFTIQRYEGDSYSTEENTEQESQNLAQLIEQARGRKRARETLKLYKQEDESTVEKTGSSIDDTSTKLTKTRRKDKGEKSQKLERKVYTKYSKSKERFIKKENRTCDAFEKG